MIAEDLMIRIRAEGKQAINEFKSVQGASTNATSSLADMAKKLIGTAGLVYAFNKLKDATVSFVRESVNTAAAIEKQRTAFEVLLKSADAGNQLMEDVIEFSAKTPFVVQELTSVAQVLIATGTEASEVSRVLENLGNAAMGDSEKLSRLADAYSKLQTKGRASLEEINRFTEAGVPILEALQAQYGITREELFEYISAGKVGFEEVDKALRAMTEGEGQFAGMLEKQSKTLSGLMSTLKGEVDLTKAAWVEAFLPSIKTAVSGAIEQLGAFRERVTAWAEANQDTITAIFINLPTIAKMSLDLVGDMIKTTFSGEGIAQYLSVFSQYIQASIRVGLQIFPVVLKTILEVAGDAWEAFGDNAGKYIVNGLVGNILRGPRAVAKLLGFEVGDWKPFEIDTLVDLDEFNAKLTETMKNSGAEVLTLVKAQVGNVMDMWKSVGEIYSDDIKTFVSEVNTLLDTTKQQLAESERIVVNVAATASAVTAASVAIARASGGSLGGVAGGWAGIGTGGYGGSTSGNANPYGARAGGFVASNLSTALARGAGGFNMISDPSVAFAAQYGGATFPGWTEGMGPRETFGFAGGMSAQQYMQSLLGRSKNPLGYASKQGTMAPEFATGKGLSIFEGGAFAGDIPEQYDVWSSQADEIKAQLEAQKKAAEDLQAAYEDLGSSLLSLAANAGIDALYEMGAAMKDGESFAKAMTGGLEDIVSTLMQNLPQLLLQAGLAIAPANIYAGLALIAASGLVSLFNGATSGGGGGGSSSASSSRGYAQNTTIVYGDIYSEDRFQRRSASVQSATGARY